jgi:hypothetical protein
LDAVSPFEDGKENNKSKHDGQCSTKRPLSQQVDAGVIEVGMQAPAAT